jgi:N-acetylated-alpha-linked acidic dipeptidase
VRERPFALTPIGSNTDYGAFIQHLGVTSLHIAYRNTGRGTYHSVFDSFTYFERFLDPDFSYGQSQSGAFAAALLRLADTPVLPWSFADQSRAYRAWAQELVTLAAAQKSGVAVGPLVAEIESLQQAAARYDASLDRALGAGSAAVRRDAAALTSINHDIFQSEKALTFPEGLPGRPWYVYPISGGSSYNGSVARTFPVLREALELRQFDLARSQIGATATAMRRLTERVNGIVDKLDAIH